MKIIKLNKKIIKFTMVIILALCLTFTIHHFIQNNISYRILKCFNVRDEAKDVEIFDVIKGKVIKKVPLNSIIQNEVEKYINGITGMYVKVKAMPDNGYIIRVPLNFSTNIHNKWLNYDKVSLKEAFVIFPKNDSPYLLMLDNKYRPLFYTFNNSTKELLENLNFKIPN